MYISLKFTLTSFKIKKKSIVTKLWEQLFEEKIKCICFSFAQNDVLVYKYQRFLDKTKILQWFFSSFNSIRLAKISLKVLKNEAKKN